MALVINEPIKTVNGLLTLALAAESQLLYTIQTDVVISSVDNYRIEIEVRDAADTFSLFDNVFIYIPNQAGLLDLDVGAIVVNYLKSEGGFSFEYFLRIVEKWEGSGEPSTDTTILQAILAKKQLLSVGGANMWENLLIAGDFATVESVLDNAGKARLFLTAAEGNVTSFFQVGRQTQVNFNSVYQSGIFVVVASSWTGTNTTVTIEQEFLGNANGTISVVDAGRFLTKFKNPLMWPGWNRTAAYLIDSEYQARTGSANVNFRQNSYDINKGFTSAIDETAYGISTNIQIRKISYLAGSSYTGISCRTGAAVTISELLFYKLECEPEFPIMLDWINTEGGIDQWLFSQYTTRVISDSGIVAETPITTDIEFITRTKRRFANSFRQQITLRAEHLTDDQLRALQEIKQTESLRVYLSKDGLNYIDGIVVTTFTTEADTKNKLNTYVVIIELPDGFIFSDGKLY